MSAAITPVTCTVTFELLSPMETSVPVRVRLSYDPADPFAVHAAFHTGADEPVRWVFAREVLAAGFTGPAGSGDVQVRPLTGDPALPGARVRHIALELSSPTGRARFLVDAAELGEFLLATYAAVPQGREADLLDLDVELGLVLLIDGEGQR
jgi:hypothetical protein